ncbi:unnamed protein product [Clonostachys rosea]|uniref:Uncharacterized protein n=1 Tax=Bionectria ochroleuca TaxID=29856 RepID=A0ABY6TYA3_BIOOC|nr:unnamed protein product [Clonostachys rosea]
MNVSAAVLRRTATLRPRATRSLPAPTRQWLRNSSNSSPSATGRPRRSAGKFIGFGVVFGVAAAGAYYYPTLKELLASGSESPQSGPLKANLEFEQPRKEALNKEEYRELLSSQHLQIQNSWEHPGVYVWGSNVGQVVDPNSNQKYIKLPQRLEFFNDQILRDLKLSQSFGAALTEKGDLVQWGLGFSKTNPKPVTTLQGKDLAKIEISSDHIIALSRNGTVYSIPSSKDDLEGGLKQEQQTGSWSIWASSGKGGISSRKLTPSGLGYGEKIVDISSGLEHCLLLTSKGRVFAVASSGLDYPSKGQMGIPGLSWNTRPSGPYDQPLEVEPLRGLDVKQIATGDYHSVVLDKAGRAFAFGDNLYGQLGSEPLVSEPCVEYPSEIPTAALYKRTGLVPKVTSIAAGGNTTFFAVEAEATSNEQSSQNVAPSRKYSSGVFDLWAAGQGVYGTLGTGKWTHITVGPNKVKSLSSLYEFDEKTNKMVPIKVKSLSVGTTHCAAVMDNSTETYISSGASQNQTYYGADILFWGGNEYYQLGTGKRSNLNLPAYIGPLDRGEGDAQKGRQGEQHRLCLAPMQTARLGEHGHGRKVTLEQKVECGQYVTGVYSSV